MWTENMCHVIIIHLKHNTRKLGECPHSNYHHHENPGVPSDLEVSEMKQLIVVNQGTYNPNK